MIEINDFGLRVLLGTLNNPDREVESLIDDLWTQMRIEGELDFEIEPDFKIARHFENFLVDADDLRQLLSWWNEHSDFCPMGVK